MLEARYTSDTGPGALYQFDYPQATTSHDAKFPATSEKPDPSEDVDGSLPKPYLGLGARLSQTWMNSITLILLLVFFRMLLASRHLQADLLKGLDDVNAACKVLQASASTAVSMPHYAALVTNSVIKHGIDASVKALSGISTDLLTAVEALVLFFVNTFKSTYVCLLELAISGSIAAVADVVGQVEKIINSTLADIANDLETGVKDANTAITKISEIIVKAASLLGETITLPTVQLPQITQLRNLQIPDTFDQDLQGLQTSLNFTAVEETVDDTIRLPFERVKALVNSSFSNYSFDQNLLMVPAKETLSFCDGPSLNSTFISMEHSIVVVYRGIATSLLLFALLAIIPVVLLEWWGWRKSKANAALVSNMFGFLKPVDRLDSFFITTKPLESYLGARLSALFKTPKSKSLARWYFSYISHKQASFVLLAAVAGLLSCGLQSALVEALHRAVSSGSVNRTTQDVSALVYDTVANTSALWADHTNAQIATTQAELNADLFGWVLTSTTAVNDTLTVFTDTVVNALNATFGGTILFDPILKVLDCIILIRVRGIEQGLTWVHDHAHIDLPTIQSDALAISRNDTLDFQNSEQDDAIDGMLNKLVAAWRASIQSEVKIAGALLAVWVFIALLGLLRCLVAMRSTPKTPFSGCMVKDVRQCISRPRPASEPMGLMAQTSDETESRAGPEVSDNELPGWSRRQYYRHSTPHIVNTRALTPIIEHDSNHRSFYGVLSTIKD